MERAALRGKLHLSGIDGAAAETARRRGLGFEITAFCQAVMLEDPQAVSAAERETAGIGSLWLHAPFAELHPCAIDPLVRDTARLRYRQAIAMARRLGVERIVIHDGFVPFVYFPEWFVEQSVAFWREFLPEVPEHMTIALENVMDPGPDMLAQIMAQVDDPRLGVCLDVGHANTTVSSTAVMDWIAPLIPWLRHVHLHNNSGGWDLHDPLGEGNIPMEQVLDTLLARCPAATYTIENMNCAPSLDWLAARGYLGEITL